jgi:hypothetical protein
LYGAAPSHCRSDHESAGDEPGLSSIHPGTHGTSIPVSSPSGPDGGQNSADTRVIASR